MRALRASALRERPAGESSLSVSALVEAGSLREASEFSMLHFRRWLRFGSMWRSSSKIKCNKCRIGLEN